MELPGRTKRHDVERPSTILKNELGSQGTKKDTPKGGRPTKGWFVNPLIRNPEITFLGFEGEKGGLSVQNRGGDISSEVVTDE